MRAINGAIVERQSITKKENAPDAPPETRCGICTAPHPHATWETIEGGSRR